MSNYQLISGHSRLVQKSEKLEAEEIKGLIDILDAFIRNKEQEFIKDIWEFGTYDLILRDKLANIYNKMTLTIGETND